MKVLAINGSPHLGNGNTGMILTPFLTGMKDAGAEVETLYTKKLTIKPCLGCLNCWTKTPGRCVITDDMADILIKIKMADILVFATPVYWDGVSGPMKMFMDRMTPLGEPFIEVRDGRSRHPVREGYGHGMVVLVATCGYFELENFDPMITHYKAVAENLERKFAGALLRPNAMSMKPAQHFGIPIDDIFDAAEKAGTELVKDGVFLQETLKNVSRDFMTLEQFQTQANVYFKKVLDKIEE
jgi:multimeric flavodoxin WrbA